MWQLGADQPRADGNGFPGCRQLTSGAGLRCHGAWPGEPGALHLQGPGLLLLEALGLQSALMVREW